MGKRQRRLRWNKANYKELIHVKLPIFKRRRIEQKLYPVEVLEQRPGRVKVHYVGYDSSYDEWKNEADLEELRHNSMDGLFMSGDQFERTETETYLLYKKLSLRIKKALSCNRTASPLTRITMLFDVSLFNDGLKLVAIPSKKSKSNQHYKIKHYQDLNHLLGTDWHVRVINVNGDYGYVVLDTVQFYIRKKDQWLSMSFRLAMI